MKKLFIILAILCGGMCVSAQFTTIAQSASFREDPGAMYRLLAMKNGNVFIVAVNYEKDIKIQMYSADHKLQGETTYQPDYNQLKSPEFTSLFEISGDAVLMISGKKEKQKGMFRLIIDGKTGKLKTEDRVAETGDVFYTCHDPLTNSYAIASLYTTKENDAKVIGITSFTGDHKIHTKAEKEVADEDFNLMYLKDITMHGPDQVNVLIRHYFTVYKDFNKLFSKPKGERKEITYLGYVEPGASTVKLNPLAIPTDSVLFDPKIIYNPHTKKLVIACATTNLTESQDVSTHQLLFVNPVTREVEKRIQTHLTKDLLDKGKRITGNKKYPYWGPPHSIIINDNGAITVVHEEWNTYYHTNSRGLTSWTARQTYAVLLTYHDKDGNLLHNLYIPKNAYYAPERTIFYGSGFVNEFKKIFVVSGRKGDYVLYNDTPRNIDRVADEKFPVQIDNTIDCDAFCFARNNNDILAERKYLFGKSEDKSGRAIVATGISQYDKNTGILIVLRRFTKNTQRELDLVWLKSE